MHLEEDVLFVHVPVLRFLTFWNFSFPWYGFYMRGNRVYISFYIVNPTRTTSVINMSESNDVISTSSLSASTSAVANSSTGEIGKVVIYSFIHKVRYFTYYIQTISHLDQLQLQLKLSADPYLVCILQKKVTNWILYRLTTIYGIELLRSKVFAD